MKRIVVGVDGSPGSVAALAWAFALASETGASVEAVMAWELAYGWIDGYAPDIERWCEESARQCERRLDAVVAAASVDVPPPASLVRSVVEGAAAQVLLDASKDADLLVVGSRGRGGFTGLLLGSVSQQCVHHGQVPVTVVPQPG